MLHRDPYRLLAAVLVAALPCLAVDCPRTCDDCLPPCQPQRVGSLSLQARSRAWLPDGLPDSVRFVNSNGYRTTLRRSPITTDSVGQTAVVNGTDPYYLLTLNSAGGCGEYYATERRTVSYTSRTLPLTLHYGLVRDLRGTYPPPAGQLTYAAPISRSVADTLPDMVLVDFNGTSLRTFPVVRRPFAGEFQGVRYLDSVRVGGQWLRRVYRHTQPSYPGSSLWVREVYFQPGQGVVGFTYSNNEEWVRY